tara:strand:+ start:81 stop:287 length:207 start_codon:yes stop_codon:yes gene_type:complete
MQGVSTCEYLCSAFTSYFFGNFIFQTFSLDSKLDKLLTLRVWWWEKKRKKKRVLVYISSISTGGAGDE